MMQTVQSDDWISFGEVAHGMCGMQSQYCSRYIDGRHECPNLGAGLRFRNWCPSSGPEELDVCNYHFIQVHREDAEEFARRVNDHRLRTHQISEVPQRRNRT